MSRQPAQTVPAGQAVEALFGEHQGEREAEEDKEVMFVAVDTAKKFHMNRST